MCAGMHKPSPGLCPILTAAKHAGVIMHKSVAGTSAQTT